MTPSRRKFLGALGALGLGATLPRRALAEENRTPTRLAGIAADGKPLRFVGVYMPHGCAYELWKPGPEFDLTYPDASLAPFDAPERFGRSFKDRLLVIDGLDLAAGIEVGTVGHDASRVILTGSGVTGTTPSIDQYLAVDQGLGAETPHTTLTLAVGNDSTELGKNISYASGGTPVPKWIDPVAVFDELFGAPLTEASREQLAALRRRRRSVLDFVRRDLQRLAARAPHDDRAKLDHHGTALREIEKRIEPATRQCNAPPRPDRAQFPFIESHGAGALYRETVTNLLVDLLARALSCDIVRFSSLMLDDLTRTNLYPELPTDIHQGVAHRYSSRSEQGQGNPDSWKALALQNRHTHAQIARLLQRLDEGGVLEHTFVLAQSDLGDPALHSSRNVPTLLAGGCGGAFTMGRTLDLRSGKGKNLLPNNRLLVSICRAFGLPTQRFGHSTLTTTMTGTLDGLGMLAGGDDGGL